MDLEERNRIKQFASTKTNTTSPSPSRLEELAKLYEVSVDAIRKYDFTTPIEKIYYQMWYEKQYLYNQLNIDPGRFAGSAYNINVYNGIQEWKKIIERRENYEISDEEYLDRKLNYKIDKPMI